MDPAELHPIKSALQNQGVVIGRHEQLLHDMQPASAGASPATPALVSPLPLTQICWGARGLQRFSLAVLPVVSNSNPPGSQQRGLKPGSKNTKPDALSRQWAPPGPDPSPEPIIPAPRILAPLCWELETAIREAQQREPDPGGGPPFKLYVPVAVWQQVLWGHTSPFMGHPGVTRTLEFLHMRFGAWRETSVPLSHLVRHMRAAIQLGHGPKVSSTCCLSLCDHGPMSPWTLLWTCLLPEGPQFASRFWKAFCWLMGASVSLSSSFHPESNGQTKRVIQDLAQTLWCLTSTNPSSWTEHLPWAEYANNTLQHSSLGMSPFVSSAHVPQGGAVGRGPCC
ncbi:hypothetical protein SRHO_G00071220 [Serrasalmus rhombeus]